MSVSEAISERMTLTAALAAFYKAFVLERKEVGTAANVLRDYVADPKQRAEAEKRLMELRELDKATGGRLADRCFVSSVSKTGLEAVLS